MFFDSGREAELERALRWERERHYVRLKGGYPVLIASALYWAVLAVGGAQLSLQAWVFAAFVGSYFIFPVGWLLSLLLGVNVVGERTAASSVMIPAFVGMTIFWPMAVLAFWSAPELVSAIMAIGMAIHWPVVGWTYGRSELYSAHAIARALLVSVLWLSEPEARLIWIPASVTFLYVLTLVAIFVDLRETALKTSADSPS